MLRIAKMEANSKQTVHTFNRELSVVFRAMIYSFTKYYITNLSLQPIAVYRFLFLFQSIFQPTIQLKKRVHYIKTR